MKLNPISELVLNFNKMSLGEKIKKSQEIENMVAKFQGRKARNITTKIPTEILEQISEGREPCACYVRAFPRNLFIMKISDSPYDLIKDIIHEGWHAYIDDYIKGKVSLKTFSPFDKAKFVYEEKNMPAIYTEFEKQGIMPLYDSFFIEERLNYQEDTLYMIKYIIGSIENAFDAMRLKESIVSAMAYYVENERRGRKYERTYGAKYEDLIEIAIQNSSEDQIDLSKAGRVVDQINPDLLKFFNKFYKLMNDYFDEQESSVFVNKNDNTKLEEISEALLSFISEILSQKVKI